MAVVIDTCSFHLVFDKAGLEYRVLFDWLTHPRKKGKIGFDEALFNTYSIRGDYGKILKELRIKRSVFVRDEEVNTELSRIKKRCRSNDARIIALMLVGGFRLICSEERKKTSHKKKKSPLVEDVKQLVKKPAAKFYNENDPNWARRVLSVLGPLGDRDE